MSPVALTAMALTGDLQADWEAYAGEATALLKRAGYEPTHGRQYELVFANRVPGDSTGCALLPDEVVAAQPVRG
jgi:hypothetical protein